MPHIHSLHTSYFLTMIEKEIKEIFKKENFYLVEGINTTFAKKRILPGIEIEIIFSINRNKSISLEFFSSEEDATIINFLRYIPSPLKMRVNNLIKSHESEIDRTAN